MMAQRAEQKEEARARLLSAAGRGFRRSGYGLGVDALAKEAGVTSGAFYAHFRSKAAAFRETVVAGLRNLLAVVDAMRAAHGASWRAAFVDYYLGDSRMADISESCALQSLTGEVARADALTREAYQRELDRVIVATAADLGDAAPVDRRAEAIALLAMLSGGVALTRAVSDRGLADEIAAAIKLAASRLERRDSSNPDRSRSARDAHQ